MPYILLLVGIGFALFAFQGTASGETTMQTNNQDINHNRNTWPSGNKIWDLCQAIAHAEGYDVEGSVPNRLNNPGDLSPEDAGGHPSEFHDGSNVASLPDANTGWNYLYAKISRIANGSSHVYPLSFTFEQMAHEYAGDSYNWLNNVVNDLRHKGYTVNPDTRLGDFFQ